MIEDVVIIPAYNPDERLVEFVNEIYEHGLGIIVVNDGSRHECKSVFDNISEKAKLITLEKNGGKGGALKRGMKELLNVFPECKRFITADADGQHKTEDIIRVLNELKLGAGFVLTVRNFRGDIPTRSKIGNDLSRVIYSVLTGHYFRDNQSGLRGFNINNIEWLVRVGGEKYDYEMNMLYIADKQAIPITTILIDALYIDGNKSSHFDPVKDTLRIYKRLFRSAWVSFATFALYQEMVFVLSLLFGYRFLQFTVPLAGATSAGLCFILNRFIAFRRYKYRDWLRMIAYTVVRFMMLTAGCAFASYATPDMPMFIAFNISLIISVPLEYYIRKFMHIARYNDINKER